MYRTIQRQDREERTGHKELVSGSIAVRLCVKSIDSARQRRPACHNACGQEADNA